jgi:AcrR family transcriptional regulator
MARRSDHSREQLYRMALDGAREIVSADGLRGLSTRRLAGLIGYTAGTLYQLFEDLDDLIVHLNAETLDGLFEACHDSTSSASPDSALLELADRYLRYVDQNPKLWSALFEHSLPVGRDLPAWYYERTTKLFDLGAEVIQPLVGEGNRAGAELAARVLWAGVYGIAALASSSKLGQAASAQQMAHYLVRTFVAGLGSISPVDTSRAGSRFTPAAPPGAGRPAALPLAAGGKARRSRSDR